MCKKIFTTSLLFIYCLSKGQSVYNDVKKDGNIKPKSVRYISRFVHNDYNMICSLGYLEEFLDYSIVQLSGYRDSFQDELLLFFKKKKLIKAITFPTESLVKSGTGFKTKEVLGELSYNIDTVKKRFQIIHVQYSPYRVDTLKDRPYFKNIKICSTDTTYFNYLP
jgi:hypothetical protein